MALGTGAAMGKLSKAAKSLDGPYWELPKGAVVLDVGDSGVLSLVLSLAVDVVVTFESCCCWC